MSGQNEQASGEAVGATSSGRAVSATTAAAGSAPDLLAVEGARISYRVPGRGRVEAVRGIDLRLAPGTVLGLVGESGCGKSTVAKAVCGLVPLDEGRILHRGELVRPLRLRRRTSDELRIQMVFQNPYASLNPRRRIGEQIGDGLRIARDPSRWDVASLLDAVELDADAARRFPHQFSGGQRQRIAIARAIATGPDVLIGDEPIASLDASLQAKIAQLMRRLALDAGASMLFISHDLSVVRIIADEIAVMQAGRIVETGATNDVWTAPQEAYTQRLLAAVPKADGAGTLPG